MLRPSISRRIEATQDDLLESAEAKAAMVYGSPTPEQTEWVDTFLTAPPSVEISEALHVTMSSAELAKVKEIPQRRRFDVGSEDGRQSIVFYNPSDDTLYCHRHQERDGCACTSRVRLCGILTGDVIADVKHYRRAK